MKYKKNMLNNLAMKLLLYSLITMFFISCQYGSENETDFKINGSRVDLGKISDKNIDEIIFESTEGNEYCLVLDSAGRIIQIQNIIRLPSNKEYVNTWIGLDKYGQLDLSLSYYYETFLNTDDTMVYLNCSIDMVLLDNSKYSILFSDFNADFETKSKIDTIQFNKDFVGVIPIKDWKIGDNNVKFILLEEGDINGKPTYKKTYINKDIFIKDPETEEQLKNFFRK